MSCDEEYTSLKLCAWYSPKPGQHIGREKQTKLVRAPKDLFHPRVNRVMQSPFIRSAIHHVTHLDSGDGLLRLHHARGLGRLPLAHLRSEEGISAIYGEIWGGWEGGGFVGKR